MAEELSYLLITPYTIKKSRTGGVIARLLSRTDLDLVGAQILSPTKEFAEEYAASLRKTVGKHDKQTAELLANYVIENFIPQENGRSERVMMLLFRGEDACRKIFSIAGSISSIPVTKEKITGETIRDTFADLVMNRDGSINYFEPAVLTPPESDFDKLRIFAEFAAASPNVVENIASEDSERQRTLVIIKPDNWRHPSTKPGNIIDMFSRTGLRIVGCKVHQMSVADALEFYGPVQDVLREKLAPKIGEKSREILEKEFSIKLHDDDERKLTEMVGKNFADDQFHQIIEFMSGLKPGDCPDNEKASPGKVKCVILIYEGKDAINKIRTVLGPTDPTKAPSGTIRREFGHDVMVNTAHASDAPESVQRESKIVRIEENPLSKIIMEFINK